MQSTFVRNLFLDLRKCFGETVLKVFCISKCFKRERKKLFKLTTVL